MQIYKDNYIVGLRSSDGELMACKAYPALGPHVSGYVLPARTTDGIVAMRLAPLAKYDVFGLQTEYEWAATPVPVTTVKSGSISRGDGQSGTLTFTFNFIPEFIRCAFNVDDVVVVSTKPIQFGTLGTYSLVAEDGFVLGGNSGFIDTRSGQTLRVNIGTRSISQTMDHDIYPAEWKTICQAAGVRSIDHHGAYGIKWMRDESEMDVHPLQTITLYVGLLAIGSGFCNGYFDHMSTKPSLAPL